MKMSKMEQAILAITLFALTAMVFFYLGSRSAAQPVTITAAEPRPSATVELPAKETSSTPPAEDEAQEEPEKKEPTLEELAPIDINHATVEELMLLPSIGEVRAQAIVDYRESSGPFRYVEDLRKVKGIGEGILAQVMDYLTVSEGEANG